VEVLCNRCRLHLSCSLAGAVPVRVPSSVCWAATSWDHGIGDSSRPSGACEATC